MADLFEKVPLWDEELKWQRLVICAGFLRINNMLSNDSFKQICGDIVEMMSMPDHSPEAIMSKTFDIINITEGN